MLEVTVTEGYIMDVYDSIEPFYFSMTVTSSAITPNTVNTWVVTALKWISTPSFITVDIFAVVVP